MLKKGDEYRRVYGNKQVVTILAVSDPKGIVKLKDTDGMHFVNRDSFKKYFKKV